ncbi:MAG: ANTAR domain-containing protein [Pseudomonadota bacterium]
MQQTPDVWNNDYFSDTYFRNGKPEATSGYCTDVWFDELLKFIGASDEKPFFAYLATNAAHGPFNAPSEYRNLYKDADLFEGQLNFFGMLTNLVLARSKWEQFRQLSNKNNRLEKKLLAQKKIADAKRIIMDAHAVNEQEAYSILRSEAMTKRVSIEEMAITFINANNLLSKRKTNI